MANKFFISTDSSVMDNIKELLDKYVEGYTSDSNSICSYIVDRGIDLEDNITLIIKSAIQNSIIKHCTTLVANNTWDNTLLSYGLESYLTPKYIAKVLKKSLTKISDEIVEEAQMLCFQQICIISETSNKTGCLDRFVETYPEIALKALKTHPEYCMDGWIFHRVSKKLSEDGYGFEDIPIVVETIDFLLGGEEVEEDHDSTQEDVEAIGKIFSNIEAVDLA